jgi:GTPase involved in cell partitioning and DNA repair
VSLYMWSRHLTHPRLAQYYIHYSLPARGAGLAAGALLALLCLETCEQGSTMRTEDNARAGDGQAGKQRQCSGRDGKGAVVRPISCGTETAALLGAHPEHI